LGLTFIQSATNVNKVWDKVSVAQYSFLIFDKKTLLKENTLIASKLKEI